MATALALAALALLGAAAPPPAAALEPDEVLVLVDGLFGDGGAIFDHLRARRGVPKENIFVLRGMPGEESIPRKDFERRVLAPLRAELARPERARIRCLVTTRGIPLRVWRAEASALPATGTGTPAADAETTIASLDSELSLLLCPPPSLAGWAPNPLLAFGAPGPPGLPQLGATRPLLVARVDGPTLEIAKGLIDKALAAEKDGLQGTFYFDARGLHDSNATGLYDERIRLAARYARERGLDVKLDDNPALFQKGSCPRAACYVGWYALQSYTPAFEFRPGAFGFHIASCECESLRHGNTWVKGLLTDGIAATLGPTDEPYLQSFPDPLQFVGRALDGRRTLAEVYWETVPQASWRQVFIGDPFYRPRVLLPDGTALPPAGGAK